MNSATAPTSMLTASPGLIRACSDVATSARLNQHRAAIDYQALTASWRRRWHGALHGMGEQLVQALCDLVVTPAADEYAEMLLSDTADAGCCHGHGAAEDYAAGDGAAEGAPESEREPSGSRAHRRGQRGGKRHR